MPANFKNPEPQTVSRLRHICSLMRKLKWVTGETCYELAKEWGLSDQRVRELSAEASKIVRRELMSHDHVASTVGAALDKALRHTVEDGDWRTVASLARVYADASGASAPTRVEATIGDDSLATSDRARQLMKERFRSDVGKGLTGAAIGEEVDDTKPA